jgi:hypothetical protein
MRRVVCIMNTQTTAFTPLAGRIAGPSEANVHGSSKRALFS